MSDHLTGRIYVAENQRDRIMFIDRRTMVFDWVLENENFSIETENSISGEGEIIFTLTSAQAAFFPYHELKLDRSKDQIVAYGYDNHKCIFSIRE